MRSLVALVLVGGCALYSDAFLRPTSRSSHRCALDAAKKRKKGGKKGGGKKRGESAPAPAPPAFEFPVEEAIMEPGGSDASPMAAMPFEEAIAPAPSRAAAEAATGASVAPAVARMEELEAARRVREAEELAVALRAFVYAYLPPSEKQRAAARSHSPRSTDRPLYQVLPAEAILYRAPMFACDLWDMDDPERLYWNPDVWRLSNA